MKNLTDKIDLNSLERRLFIDVLHRDLHPYTTPKERDKMLLCYNQLRSCWFNTMKLR